VTALRACSHPSVRARLARLRHLWLDAGYNGRNKGKDWVERGTGWRVQTVEAVHRYKRYWVPNDIPQTNSTGRSICPNRAFTCSRAVGWWKGLCVVVAQSAPQQGLRTLLHDL
jgi:hypothetical protein